jgi:hypothetical protein
VEYSRRIDNGVGRDFSTDEYATVMAILDEYGAEKWHGEHSRVHLAVLKVANGSVQRLRDCIEVAKTDYRDALAAAEYPAYCKMGWRRDLPTEDRDRLIESDWRQYDTWLNQQ